MLVLQRRTSYFPGLGWMLRREVWLEIGAAFPDQAWDHWMRLNSTSRGKLTQSLRLAVRELVGECVIIALCQRWLWLSYKHHQMGCILAEVTLCSSAIASEANVKRTFAGRDCVVPEVSRNRNIGEVGANMNAATFRKFLNGMAWAQAPVENFGDLDYLQQEAYEASQAELTAAAQLWQGSFKDAAFEPGKVKPCSRAGEAVTGSGHR